MIRFCYFDYGTSFTYIIFRPLSMSLMQIRFSDEACDGEDQMYEAAMASSSQTIQEEEKQKKTLEDIEWWIEKAEKTTNKVTHAVLEIAERQHLVTMYTDYLISSMSYILCKVNGR